MRIYGLCIKKIHFFALIVFYTRAQKSTGQTKLFEEASYFYKSKNVSSGFLTWEGLILYHGAFCAKSLKIMIDKVVNFR